MATKEKKYLQLKVSIADEHPPVWRRLIVPADFRLDQTHAVIQIAFGWSNYHLYQFLANSRATRYYVPEIDPDFHVAQSLASKIKLKPLLARDDLKYTYDLGDEWDHVIHLEKTLSEVDLNGKTAPFCLTGRGPNKKEDAHYMKDNDAEPFNKARINRELRRAFPTEDTMPEQYQVDDASLGVDEDNQSMNSAQPQAGGDAQSNTAINDAVHLMTGKNLDAVFATANQLIHALNDQHITDQQQLQLSTELLDKKLVLYKMDQDGGDDALKRIALSMVVDALLRSDRQDLLLPMDQVEKFIDQIEERMVKEMDVIPLSGTMSGMGAALTLLRTAIDHPGYAPQRAADLSHLLLKMLTHLDGPFLSEEPDQMAGLFLDLARFKKMPAAEMNQQLQIVTLTLANAWLKEDADVITFYQKKSWERVLSLLYMLLEDAKGYKTVWHQIKRDLLLLWKYPNPGGRSSG